MEGLDLVGLINDLNLDPRLIAALVAIVSFLKRMISWLHDRYAEITAFIIAQALAWGSWFAESWPAISTIGMNLLTGVAIWIAGKAGYNAFQKVLKEKGYSDPDEKREKEQADKKEEDKYVSRRPRVPPD